ncbi:hypothetical protein A2533_01100 [Candidatus Falkowbacteria bacterium RIFOXYD2_FULL_35_9]|uniref:Transposase IS200-like domain-containing protein n=1 Tax=Candidatus Falkowbacteria bacterium RIFOXYC2_FULL_36_12 TaxID=1798002 RepID=A0A1F5SW96_9BACT|nr:MAG: hypothetical protein A2300_02150 [Candidatus Falkowbacteria bacterium RIFOXYB2_FULL_35_7]OGF31007.1 MAG: hypothetical protein A2478_01025 [Candidatus Falkowbacteria bacterium RIFOXYC2_FULL_36_12]OGF34435.1 MAG: hypothetical protein A2223_02825 [Candidatus Falkowbacteria bacterium RIFOXYA2_FULL_35_8]OGF47849.1 MAG: hypothetical protein A2533_01100 [Candidatus Falkowbacteria bacterium RIFOXYD2_FULL_35_9]
MNEKELYRGKYKGIFRLKNWDYSSPGFYFITICVKNRFCCLGTVENNEMLLNELGKIVRDCWYDLPNHYKNCVLDEFIIMPDHVHGIIQLIDDESIGDGLNPQLIDDETVGDGFKPSPTNNVYDKKYKLCEIIRGFKTFSARKINKLNNSIGVQFWQKQYYDHIIRNDESLDQIRIYIKHNPINQKK